MTDRDRRRLVGCDVRLISKLDDAFADMAALGHTMMITSGLRTAGEQAVLWSIGRDKPGRIVTYADGIHTVSNHQRGRAADVCFVVDGQPSWDESLPWELWAETAVRAGLVSGYYWRRQDKPHVELAPEPTTPVTRV